MGIGHQLAEDTDWALLDIQDLYLRGNPRQMQRFTHRRSGRDVTRHQPLMLSRGVGHLNLWH